MNTIVSMNISANYPAPDIAQMAATVRQMGSLRATADALFTRTGYQPTLQTTFRQLSINLNTTDRALRDAALKMSQLMKSNIQDLAELENDLQEEGLDDEDRDYLIKEGQKVRNKMLALVKVEDGKLLQLLRGLDQKLDRQLTEKYLADQTGTVETINADIERLAAELTKLQEQRKVLTEGITALEGKGYAEQGQDAIVQVEKLAAGGMTMPEAEVIKFALEEAKRVMETIEKNITFFTMLKARDTVVNAIKAVQAKQAAKQSDLGVAGLRIEFIRVIHDMDSLRATYLAEASKVTQATGFFVTTFSAGLSQSETSLAANAKSFSNYMNAIAYSRR
jgi:hypothetical protein